MISFPPPKHFCTVENDVEMGGGRRGEEERKISYFISNHDVVSKILGAGL